MTFLQYYKLNVVALRVFQKLMPNLTRCFWTNPQDVSLTEQVCRWGRTMKVTHVHETITFQVVVVAAAAVIQQKVTRCSRS